MSTRRSIYLARIRIPLVLTAAALIAAGSLLDLPGIALAGLVLLVVGMAIYLRIGTVRRDPVEVRPPVAGRWLAVNSPADRVPSHGLHAYGQTYAIDLVHEPEGRPRPGFAALWPLARRPGDYPAFGQPVLAPAGGVVVRAHDRERDHWSRTSVPALLYLLPEAGLRELLGPGRILGNHVVIDLGGVYALLAHLRRQSTRVTVGQRVAAGEQVAECGNSGNSTEPHLHFQLMDHRHAVFAAGLPVRFDRFEVDGAERDGVPGKARPFVAAPRPATDRATPTGRGSDLTFTSDRAEGGRSGWTDPERKRLARD
jgi:Peptidase family M23